MSQSGTVGMDRYWNYIVTPLFFTVISFGVFALFTAKDIQIIDDATMRSTVKEFKQAFASGSEDAKAAPVKPLAKPVAPVKPMGKPSSVAKGSP